MGKCGRKEVEKDQIMRENKISDLLLKPEHIKHTQRFMHVDTMANN